MAFVGIGAAMGPVISGAITQKATWRWCKFPKALGSCIQLITSTGFYINPIIIGPMSVAILAIPFPTRAMDHAPFSVKRALRSLDLFGFSIFAPSITMFLIALEWGGTIHPWNSSIIIGLLCGSAATAIIFFLWEHRIGDSAMLPFSMITRRKVILSCATISLSMGGLMQLTYYLPLWFQAGMKCLFTTYPRSL